jgi:hypothetical protein
MADDASVQFDQFAKTMGAPTEVSDPLIVPRFEEIHRAPPNAPALIKGNLWSGIRGIGLTHKSPNVPKDASGSVVVKRIMLKVDVAPDRPGAGFFTPLPNQSPDEMRPSPDSEREWRSMDEDAPEKHAGHVGCSSGCKGHGPALEGA